MAGIDDALANDPGFVGPGIWHTESSLYTLVWNAGSWHIVFVLCLVIALIGVIPFCFRCQKSESEGCQKCVQYFSALAFLPIWAFYAIFTFLIIFDPLLDRLWYDFFIFLIDLVGVRGSPARGYFPPARVEGGWSKTGNSSNRRRRRRRPKGSKSKKTQRSRNRPRKLISA